MLNKFSKKLVISWLVKLCVLAPIAASTANAQDAPKVQAVSMRSFDRNGDTTLVAAIRHELFTLPYYDVFDWLDAEIHTDGSVTLRGDVVRPTTRSDAEARVRRIEGVTAVRNEINVLPPHPTDNAFRVALYRAIYNWNSPLFRYGARAMPPIHIVVNNGRATLRGVVASPSDSQYAYAAARQVSGLFEVRNELRIE